MAKDPAYYFLNSDKLNPLALYKCTFNNNSVDKQSVVYLKSNLLWGNNSFTARHPRMLLAGVHCWV